MMVIVPIILDPHAAEMGEMVVQELTGLPVIWKPLRTDGLTDFDDHPFGEGYSLADLQRDTELKASSPGYANWRKDGNRGTPTEYLRWRRAGCFVRVRMTRAEAAGFFDEEDDPGFNGEEERDEQTGVVLRRVRMRPLKRFRPEALHSLTAPSLRAPKAKTRNVLTRAALVAPDAVVPTTFADAAVLRAPLDTFHNAILTVGTGKTYAAIGTAITAMSSGDTTAVFATGAGKYVENVSDGGKHIQLIGMIADQGVIVEPTAGTYAIVLTGHSFCQNFTIHNGGSCQQGITMTGWGDVLDCISYGFAFGYNTGGSRITFANCLAYNCPTHGFRIENYSCVYHGTAVDCGVGFNNTSVLGFEIACLGAGNTTDFVGGHATISKWNCSEDGTAVGVAAQTGFDTADFTDYAGDDFTLGTTTTQAKFDGEPPRALDATRQIRKGQLAANVFYAGYSDPDPVESDFGAPDLSLKVTRS